MRRIACIAISTTVLLMLAAVPSGAGVVLERTGLASATGGIALGPDGNLGVNETGSNSVVRLKPNDAAFRKRRLRPGTRVVIKVTKAASIGSIATATVRRARAPRIVRRCLVPGADAPRRC